MKILILAAAIVVAARAAWNFSQGHPGEGISESFLAVVLVALVAFGQKRQSP